MATPSIGFANSPKYFLSIMHTKQYSILMAIKTLVKRALHAAGFDADRMGHGLGSGPG